jgi:hypothetical protein
MTKKLGVCGSPPEPRFGLYEGDGICTSGAKALIRRAVYGPTKVVP